MHRKWRVPARNYNFGAQVRHNLCGTPRPFALSKGHLTSLGIMSIAKQEVQCLPRVIHGRLSLNPGIYHTLRVTMRNEVLVKVIIKRMKIMEVAKNKKYYVSACTKA